jgi:WD40 repeat protein
MPEVDDAAARDDPLLVVLTAVGSALDDCERVLSDPPDRSAAEALEFSRFLRAELPRQLEDWQMRHDDLPGGAVADQPADDLPIQVADPVTLRGHTAAVKYVAFSPDGATLASADARGVVRLWDARTGRRTGKLGRRHLAMGVMSLAFSPDARILAAAAPALTLWNLKSAAIKGTLPTQTPSDQVWSVAYDPVNDLMATGISRDSVHPWNHDSVHLWNPRTRQKIRTLLHPGTVLAVTFSPDGATLASGGMSTNVLVWDTRTGRQRHVLTGHRNTIHALAFSPDGQILASASYDRTIRLWDVRTGHAIATLKGHSSSVMAVAFHPGGTILASGGASASVDYPDDDRTVRLWNIRTMRPITTLTGHTGTVSGVAFHPDGTHLASGSFDMTVRLWPIKPSRRSVPPSPPPPPLRPTIPPTQRDHQLAHSQSATSTRTPEETRHRKERAV